MGNRTVYDASSPHSTLDRIRQALAAPLPGAAGQLRMAPAYRADPATITVEGRDCRCGGVLVLLYLHDGELHLLLTVRAGGLRHHSGQVSFPGGSCEPGETSLQAALRETHEECGLDPRNLQILGELTPLYIPPSNFCIYPHVAFTEGPLDLRPHDAEVAALLEVPLAFLAAHSTRRVETWELRGEPVEVPFYAIGDYKVWGATAMVLGEFLAVLQNLQIY